MAAMQRFWLWFLVLLAFPAALYVAGSGAAPASALRYFAGNYLWMAAPHLVLAAFAFRPQYRRPALLYGLGVLNLALLAFWLWVRLAVPPQESGLAWVLYFPVAGAALALLAIIALVLRRRQTGGTVGA